MIEEKDNAGWITYGIFMLFFIFLVWVYYLATHREPVPTITEEAVQDSKEWCLVEMLDYREGVYPESTDTFKVEISEDKKWVHFYAKCSK